jgi:hypothetical protein
MMQAADASAEPNTTTPQTSHLYRPYHVCVSVVCLSSAWRQPTATCCLLCCFIWGRLRLAACLACI